MAEISLVYTQIRALGGATGATHAALLMNFDDGREIVFRGGPSETNRLEVAFLSGAQARSPLGDLDPNLIVTSQHLGTVSDERAWQMLQGLRDDVAHVINEANIEYVPFTLDPFECAKNSNAVAWLGATYIGMGFNTDDKPIDPRFGNPILAPGLGCELPGVDLV